MKSARSIAQGLTPLIMLALAVTVGAWLMRVSVVKRAEAEREAERAAIATTKAEVGDFEVVVVSVGALEAVSSVPVVSEVSGQLVTIVPNGVRVKQGDTIAVLDAPRMARQLRDQQLQYDNARADLEQTKKRLADEVRQAQIALDQAREELRRSRVAREVEIRDKTEQRDFDQQMLAIEQERFERKRRLAEEKLVPQHEIELMTAALERDKFNLERENKDLEILKAQKESEDLDKQAAVTRAESELKRAKAAEQDETQNATMRLLIQEQQLNRFKSQIQSAEVKAPADGIVVLTEQREGMTSRVLQPGDPVWEGRPIATIPNLDKMRVVLGVGQEQARMLKRGQPAVIRVEALPGMTFEGQVSEVAQTASEEPGGVRFRGGAPTGERVFRTVVDVKDTKGAPLRPGMTATVRIIVERIPKAVSVPLECVFDREGKRIVYVRDGDDFRPVEVKTGEENVDRVVILSGLKGGEEIALRDVSAPGSSPSAGRGAPGSALPL